jgi:hypothetical protein
LCYRDCTDVEFGVPFFNTTDCECLEGYYWNPWYFNAWDNTTYESGYCHVDCSYVFPEENPNTGNYSEYSEDGRICNRCVNDTEADGF